MQARAQELEQRRSATSAADRWVAANHLRYLQRPLHHLGKDMLAALKPGGPLPDQHAAEMDLLENRAQRRGGLFGANAAAGGGGGGGSALDVLLELVLADAAIELCLRRLVLHIMLRGALPEAQLSEAFNLLLDAYGHEHIATLTNLEAAGLLTARLRGRSADAESSGAGMRALLDRAEANTRSQKNSLVLSSIVTPVPESTAAAPDAAAPQSPYGRYRPVSALLVTCAMRRYMPDWAKVCATALDFAWSELLCA